MSAELSARLCLLSLRRCCWLLSSGTSTTVVLGPFQGKCGSPLRRPFTVFCGFRTPVPCAGRETSCKSLWFPVKLYCVSFPGNLSSTQRWVKSRPPGVCAHKYLMIANLLQRKSNFGTMLKLTWHTKVWPERVRSKHRISSAGTEISAQQTSRTGDNNIWNHHSRTWLPGLQKTPWPCDEAGKLCESGRQQEKLIVFVDNVGNTLCKRKFDISFKGLGAFRPDHSSGHHPTAISWGSSSYSTACIIHVTCLDNLSNPWNLILINHLK